MNRLQTALTVLALVCLSLSELLIIYTESSRLVLISRSAFILLTISLAPSFKLREWVLTAFSALLKVGLWSKSNGKEDKLFALDRAAFFSAFIYLVTLLKEAAQGSPSVLKLGVYLTRQPPQQRYNSLNVVADCINPSRVVYLFSGSEFMGRDSIGHQCLNCYDFSR